MKTTDTLTTLFSHNLWANERIIEICAELTSEQMDATTPGTFGSIRDTLEHIALAERSYFSRISTGQRYQNPEDREPMTTLDLLELVRDSGTGLIEWAQKVGADDTVTVDWEGRPREIPKTIILTQVINHATEHRAQVMVILTQLGIQPPDLSSWTYYDPLEK